MTDPGSGPAAKCKEVERIVKEEIMPKRVPISAVKSLAKAQGLSQVILMGWDGRLTHVVTWGKTETDCEQAAAGGNRLKAAMDWPPKDCETQAARTIKDREAWTCVINALATVRRRIDQRKIRTGCDTDDNRLADNELDLVDRAICSVPAQYKNTVEAVCRSVLVAENMGR